MSSPSLNKELVALAEKHADVSFRRGDGGQSFEFTSEQLADLLAASTPSALPVEGAGTDDDLRLLDKLVMARDCWMQDQSDSAAHGEFCDAYYEVLRAMHPQERTGHGDLNALLQECELDLRPEENQKLGGPYVLRGYRVSPIESGAAIVGTPSKEGAAQVEAFAPIKVKIRGANEELSVVGHYDNTVFVATPPASPSEGGGEPTPVWSRKMPLHPGCEHACQQAQDYGVWPESSCRPTCAYLAREPHPEDIEGNLAASRGEAVDAARWRRLVNASEMTYPVATIADDPENDHRMLYGRKRLEDFIDGLDEISDSYAAIQSQGAKP